VFPWDVNVPKNVNNQYVHTYIQKNKHPDVHILLYILWIQNLVNVTMGCEISHKNTKYTEVVKYTNTKRISHKTNQIFH